MFGQAAGFGASIDVATLNGSNGFTLKARRSGDFIGSSVASAGDINGDGFTDLIVGAFDADPNGDNSGASYVVFGKGLGLCLCARRVGP